MLYNIVLQYSILYSFSWLCSCLADLSRVSVVRRGLCWWELTTRTWKRVLVPCLGGFLHLTFPWRWCWLNLSQSTYYSLIRIHLHIYIYICMYIHIHIHRCMSEWKWACLCILEPRITSRTRWSRPITTLAVQPLGKWLKVMIWRWRGSRISMWLGLNWTTWCHWLREVYNGVLPNSQIEALKSDPQGSLRTETGRLDERFTRTNGSHERTHPSNKMRIKHVDDMKWQRSQH